jgi:hypothetical protein
VPPRTNAFGLRYATSTDVLGGDRRAQLKGGYNLPSKPPKHNNKRKTKSEAPAEIAKAKNEA